ncbi:MAG TPA: rRNA maturation RNase YbeY [Candidatus Paceibacterota bacterium]|nr:rRNA maturation RNase YbeY [Candidatus Paceibacterota bacterium]
MSENLSVINKTKCKLPSLPFSNIKKDILGEKFELSIVFVTEKQSQEFNNRYRNKNNPTNILSFCLSKTEGEILICPNIVKTQLKDFDRNLKEMIGFLVIHGMLHLKGMEHSDKMERAEKKYDQKYFYRNRCRLINDESRGGRISKGRKKS